MRASTAQKSLCWHQLHPVFIQNNSTLHRDTNLDPRIDSAEFTLPGLHHSDSLASLHCSGSMSQKWTQFVLGSIMRPQCCSAVLPPLSQYWSWAEVNFKELNQLKKNPIKQEDFSLCAPEWVCWQIRSRQVPVPKRSQICEMWGREEVSLRWFRLAQPSKPSSRDLYLPKDHQASPPTPCLAAQMFPHLNP